MPQDAVLTLQFDSHSVLVALTHGQKLGDMALLEALKSPAFHVGALSHNRNSERRRERLLQYLAFTQDEVARLHDPVDFRRQSHAVPRLQSPPSPKCGETACG